MTAQEPPAPAQWEVTRRQILLGLTIAAAGTALGSWIGDPEAAQAAGAWGGYSNGRIPTSALTPVPADIGPYLKPDAAADYFRFSDAFRTRFGRALGITEAYRDYARQQDLYQRYKNGTGNEAAYPGTSNHGWAQACDFKSGVNSFGTAEKQWADNNGPTYGWYPTGNKFSQPEPWHFDYTATNNGQQQVIEAEAEDMYYLAITRDSDDGLIKKGWMYKQVGGAPFYAVTNLEGTFFAQQESFTHIRQIQGQDLRILTALYGYAEHETLAAGAYTISNGTPLAGPGKFTGRVIYADKNVATYPKVTVA